MKLKYTIVYLSDGIKKIKECYGKLELENWLSNKDGHIVTVEVTTV